MVFIIIVFYIISLVLPRVKYGGGLVEVSGMVGVAYLYYIFNLILTNSSVMVYYVVYMRKYIDNSFGRSVVYTLGHIVIATLCNVFITGAVVKLAITDALVEPLCNWVWYYILDVMWVKVFKNGGGV